MKLLSAAALLFLVLTQCQGAVASTGYSSFESILQRAIPNAPDGYIPLGADCARNRPVIRSAVTLSPNEISWLQKRRNNTVQPMKDLLGRLNITDFDAAAYITRYANNVSAMPNIGIAVSGGGYRALMNGGGALQAFDSRTEGATTRGHLGGLLQSSTYLAGLSGGGWLLGSIYINNFTTVTALRDSGSVWAFDNTIMEGPKRTSSQTKDTMDYWNDIYDAVAGKNAAGFETSITDYWGRALANQLIDAPNGGENYTWSSIALDPSFQDGAMPMPVLVADNRAPGEIVISSNTTVFEFNPWEFGTFDPTTFGFAPLEYLGSNFSAGVLPKGEKCVRGFDNAGLVMGTSSSLFNEGLLTINNSALPSFLKTTFSSILGKIGDANEDIADYSPNPFFHYNNATSPSAYSTSLSMVDGGEDLQNIPLHPLIQPSRHVDVIFAIDSSADTEYNWPNGTALVATYERSLNARGIANGTAFPAIPDQNTFVNLKLNTRPTFFGCNSSNLTGAAPLVVYIPNFPYMTYSNVSTFDLKYDNTQRNAIIENGYNAATMANATGDAGWPACVACAILSRSLERTGTAVSEICKQCFADHCWDGTLNSTTPLSYQPALKLSAATTSGESLARTQSTLGLTVALGVVLAVIV